MHAHININRKILGINSKCIHSALFQTDALIHIHVWTTKLKSSRSILPQRQQAIKSNKIPDPPLTTVNLMLQISFTITYKNIAGIISFAPQGIPNKGSVLPSTSADLLTWQNTKQGFYHQQKMSRNLPPKLQMSSEIFTPKLCRTMDQLRLLSSQS